jgi:hypothetical protein
MLRCCGVRALGLPPVHPLALAAIRPAVVLSLVKFLSNSASAPKIWMKGGGVIESGDD